DAAFVDVADVALVAGPFDVELFEYAVLEDGDATLLGLQHVDEHFFLHAKPSKTGVAPAECPPDPVAITSGGAGGGGDSSPSSRRLRSSTAPESMRFSKPSRRRISSGLAVPAGVGRRSISSAAPSASAVTRRSRSEGRRSMRRTGGRVRSTRYS